MGVVYRATHLRLDRRVAIKIIRSTHKSRSDTITRFQREAKITSGLGHPHIVDVFDFHHLSDGRPYIVMELLEGEDLAARIERRGPFDLAEAAMILKQASSGLQAAHDRGIIHRDLKPQNIFLCRHGQRGIYVKILDFGISKVLAAGSELTDSSSVMGTPFYMAPEQAEQRKEEVGVQTDVYAMGTIMYEMLVGQPPFSGRSIPSLLYAIVHQEPPDLKKLRPDLPDPVAGVILRSLHKLPDERYGSMARYWRAMVRALQQTGLDLSEIEQDIHAPLPAADGAETDGGDAFYLGRTLPISGDPSTSSSDVSPTVTRPLYEAPLKGKVTTLSGTTGEKEPEADQSRRPLRIAVVVTSIGLLCTAGVLAVLLTAGESDPVRSRPTVVASSPLQMDGALARDVRADAPSTRRLWITSIPPGAKVILSQDLLGRTPLQDVTVPVGRLTLVLKKRGFYSQRLEVEPGPDPLRLGAVMLQRRGRRGSRAGPPRHKAAKTVPKEIRKPSVKIRKDWIVDPIIE